MSISLKSTFYTLSRELGSVASLNQPGYLTWGNLGNTIGCIQALQADVVTLSGSISGNNQYTGTINLSVAPTITYTSLTGTFQAAETVTDIHGSTAVVVTDNGATSMTVKTVTIVSGQHALTGGLTGGTSGATATVSTFNWEDQTINLNNTHIIPTDLVLDGLVGSSTTAARDFEIWTGVGRTGTQLFTTKISGGGDTLSIFNGSTYYISLLSGNVIAVQNNIYVPQTVYITFGTAAATSETMNLNIYGYNRA